LILDIALLIVSMLFAGVLGFAAHRSSICNVKAVIEIMTTRRAHLFASFGKSVLWSIFVTLALLFLLPSTGTAGGGLSLSTLSLFGGFVCGLGMAINGSCAFATLSRLAEGDAGMAVTLTALIVGAVGTTIALPHFNPTSQTSLPPPYDPSQGWVAIFLIALGLWAVWELVRLTRTRGAAVPGVLRLSIAALLIGVANGFLFALSGNWPYTATLIGGSRELANVGPAPSAALWSLFGALLFGMIFSAIQRGSFRLRAKPRLSWLRNLFGGGLIGVGTAMIPGGNDALLLHGIPNLSPHAAPAYIAMLLGIATILICLHLSGRRAASVDCGGDICRTV
jgi:MFS family permease